FRVVLVSLPPRYRFDVLRIHQQDFRIALPERSRPVSNKPRSIPWPHGLPHTPAASPPAPAGPASSSQTAASLFASFLFLPPTTLKPSRPTCVRLTHSSTHAVLQLPTSSRRQAK